MVNHKLALVQKLHVDRVVRHEKIHFFIDDFLNGIQIYIPGGKTGVTDFQQIVFLQGVKAKTTVIADPFGFFSIGHIKEAGNDTWCVARHQFEKRHTAFSLL